MVTPAWERRPGAAGRLVHVSAMARTGEVAALLRGLVPAQAATGMSVGWAVTGGDAAFYAFTRYLHHLLHGQSDLLAADQLAMADRLATSVPHYRSVLAPQADWLATQLDAGDVVVLHDQQTLGMAPILADAGLKIVWHCHVGTTEEEVSGPSAVWKVLGAELSSVDAVMSPLPEFAPQVVPAARRHVVAPAVVPYSSANRTLSTSEVRALLTDLGLASGHADGPGRVEQDEPLPDDAPMVLQMSGWEPLKDMPGVLRCVSTLPSGVHVVLAGHNPDEVPEDQEGRAVLDQVRELRARLSQADRARVHLVLLSIKDIERQALTANALQRRADVVLQKSLAEGLGLTVTEAMMKGRAVVAADVGTLREQVSPWHNGLLVNPRDPGAVVDALRILIEDPLLRRRLGKHAAESVNRRYLISRLVADYQLFAAPGPPERVREVV